MNCKIIKLLEELVEEDEGALSPEDEMVDIGWDSITLMGFIAKVDELFGKTLTPQSVADCVTVGDVVQLVNESQ